MPELIELSGIDTSQGLPVDDGAGGLEDLGAAPDWSSIVIGGGLVALGVGYLLTGPREYDPKMYREMKKVLRTRVAKEVAMTPTRMTTWTAFGLMVLGVSTIVFFPASRAPKA